LFKTSLLQHLWQNWPEYSRHGKKSSFFGTFNTQFHPKYAHFTTFQPPNQIRTTFNQSIVYLECQKCLPVTIYTCFGNFLTHFGLTFGGPTWKKLSFCMWFMAPTIIHFHFKFSSIQLILIGSLLT